MDWIIRWGLARLHEPSTWRGLIGLATAFGATIRPDVAEAIIALGIALIGGVNVVTPEPAAGHRYPGPVRNRDHVPAERVHVDEVPTPDPSAPVRADDQRNAFKDLDRFQ